MTLRKPAATASPEVGSVDVTGSSAGGRLERSMMGTGCRSPSDGSSICFGGAGGGGGAGAAGAGVAGVACASCDCSAGWIWAQATSGMRDPENRTAAATTAEIHEEAFMALPPSLVAKHLLR